MTNQMGASGFCDCGGKFEHVDDEPGSNPDTTDSSYFCAGCKTWCVVTWDNLTEGELKREYEGEDDVYRASEEVSRL